MADKFIKAIRVRPRVYDLAFGYDLKISIYETGFFGNKRLVKIEEGSLPIKEIEKVYNDKSDLMPGDDGILLDFLFEAVNELETAENVRPWGFYYTTLSVTDILGTGGYSPVGAMDKVWTKIDKFGDYPYFEIVEDNWSINYKAKTRGFGSDEYYLNNGARISVKWFREDYVQGGNDYSDNWGREVNASGDFREKNPDSTILLFKKSVDIIPPDGVGIITFTKNDKFVSGLDTNKYYTLDTQLANQQRIPVRSLENFSDNIIISEVLVLWDKLYTDGKQVKVVDKPNVKDIPYIDPSKTPESETNQVTPVTDKTAPSDVSGVKTDPKKLPVRISIDGQNIKINAKTDLPNFYVFIGPENVDGDQISEYDSLDPEYTEGVFVGEPDNVPEWPAEYLKMPDEPDEFKNWKPPGIPTSSSDADTINTEGTDFNDIKKPIIAQSMAKISDSSLKETKSFTQLTLIREKTSSKGTSGTMYFNGKAIAVTCEQPYISAKEKPHTGLKPNENFRCIESGFYPLSLDATLKSWLAQHYVKFADSDKAVERNGVLPRINSVPGQQGIRIHAGGKKDDSAGCVLVSNKSTGDFRQVCEMDTTKYITKIIYQYKIKNIKIINEFLKGDSA
jgi:hypothetical protein